jgi:hypothetical protein
MIDEKQTKWQSKLSSAASDLNTLLNEAAKNGIFPAVCIHRNDKLFGFGVQVIEISCVLGIAESGLTSRAGGG